MRLAEYICNSGAVDFATYDDKVTETFTVTAPVDVMERFKRLLATLQWCCNVGHSTCVGMDIDGDGADSFKVAEELPKVTEDNIVRRPNTEVELLGGN